MLKTYKNWTVRMIPVSFENGETHYLLPGQQVISESTAISLSRDIAVTAIAEQEPRPARKYRKATKENVTIDVPDDSQGL